MPQCIVVPNKVALCHPLKDGGPLRWLGAGGAAGGLGVSDGWPEWPPVCHLVKGNDLGAGHRA